MDMVKLKQILYDFMVISVCLLGHHYIVDRDNMEGWFYGRFSISLTLAVLYPLQKLPWILLILGLNLVFKDLRIKSPMLKHSENQREENKERSHLKKCTEKGFLPYQAK